MQVKVCIVPQYWHEVDLEQAAIVIDVFRATTSMLTAIKNQCEGIIPVSSIPEARRRKKLYPAALLTGERKGLLIPGFELGNSPLEYTQKAVQGKTLIMTTTNGTKALVKAEQVAGKVYIGGFLNISALAEHLAREKRDILLMCAGSGKKISLEDMLCAGGIITRLGNNIVKDDGALAVEAMYRNVQNGMTNWISQSSHAHYLTQCGFVADISYSLQEDIMEEIPIVFQGKVKALK